MIGKLILTKPASVVKGSNHLTFEIASIASGIYLLKVKTKTGDHKQKLVKNPEH